MQTYSVISVQTHYSTSPDNSLQKAHREREKINTRKTLQFRKEKHKEHRTLNHSTCPHNELYCPRERKHYLALGAPCSDSQQCLVYSELNN